MYCGEDGEDGSLVGEEEAIDDEWIGDGLVRLVEGICRGKLVRECNEMELSKKDWEVM